MKRNVRLFLASLLCIGLASFAYAKDSSEAKQLENAKMNLAKAKISLPQAIETALTKTPGSNAVQAELENEHGQLQYDIEAIDHNGKHMITEIDATSGNVLKTHEETVTKNTDSERAEETASKAPVTLSKAIQAAEQKVSGGKPFEAKAEMKNGKVVFSAGILSGDKVTTVQIDSQSGKVLNVKAQG